MRNLFFRVAIRYAFKEAGLWDYERFRGEIKNMTKKPRNPKEDKNLKTKSMTILEKIKAKLKEYFKTGKSKPITPGVIKINKNGKIKIKNVK